MNRNPSYRFMVTPFEEEGQAGFLVELPDCPGCFARGKTFDEAMQNIQKRYEDWCDAAHSLHIKSRLSGNVGEKNQENNRNQMIQNFSIQVPRKLYVKLSLKAASAGRTLNGFVAMALNELLNQALTDDSNN